MGEKRRLDHDDPVSHEDRDGEKQKHKKNHKRRKPSNEHDHQSTASDSRGGTQQRPSYTYDLPRIPHYKPPKIPISSPKNDDDDNAVPELPPINNPSLLAAIFTHPNTRKTEAAGSRDDTMTYEPLEFLGDAYIEVMATRCIHARFPAFNVGQRSQAREALVKNETLAVFSRAYAWDEPGVIKTSGKERAIGGWPWTKMLGDVFEAYVGAVVEDDKKHGFRTAERWLQELWEPYLRGFERKAKERPRVNVSGMKDRLQNLLMNPKAGVRIRYVNAAPPRDMKEQGKTWFTREVTLTGWGHVNKSLGRGEDANGKMADALAVQDAFDNNMDIIMEANARKKEYERIANEAKKAMEGGQAAKGSDLSEDGEI